MASVLFVCTGNICRSPIAEGFLRASAERSGVDVTVSSVGVIGLEGRGATSEAVEAAAERGADITSHLARRMVHSHIDGADLVVCLAGEHRDEVFRLAPEAAARTFTLKELVRLLEATDDGRTLEERVRAADALRRDGFDGVPTDEDVADPMGMSLETYRATAWELEEWCSRLARALFESALRAVGE